MEKCWREGLETWTAYADEVRYEFRSRPPEAKDAQNGVYFTRFAIFHSLPTFCMMNVGVKSSPSV
jgi:hypothetical protein